MKSPATQHPFSAQAFRRRFLPRLLLLWLPSLVLDIVILAKSLRLEPVALTTAGQPDLASILQVLLGNALFLKSWGLGWYFGQRHIFKNSSVEAHHNAWDYRRKLLDFADGNFDNLAYLVHRFETIERLERKGQDIVVYGGIQKNWLNDASEVIKTRPVQQVKIPACFVDMDGLFQKLAAHTAAGIQTGNPGP